MAKMKHLRLFSKRATIEPTHKAPKYSDKELLARADEFNQNAESYWQDLAKQTGGHRHVLNKPFSGISTAANNVYRLGLMLSELRLGIGMTVLDFGAGSCWLSSCLNLMGCRTIASDISPAALELGRELFMRDSRHRPELEPQFLVYDGHKIDLPNESVDRIACFDAFHHVPNQDEVLAEMFRVLRWGGRAVLVEPGMGFADAQTSDFDEERYGVLENELDPLDLEIRARHVGFTEITLKPYPPPSSMSMTPQEYVRFVSGDASVLPMRTYQHDVKDHFTFTLAKGPHIADSRCPNLLSAELHLLEPRGKLIGAEEAMLPLLFEIRNTGDSHWRHEVDPLGGYVSMGINLLTPDRQLVTVDYLRATLPCDVAPGETVRLLVQVPLPKTIGRYLLHIDLVSEDVAWFSQMGSPVLDLEVEVLANAKVMQMTARIEPIRGEKQPCVSPTTTADPCPSDVLQGQNGDLCIHAGGFVRLPVRITNLGPCSWPYSPVLVGGAIRLGAQLLDLEGQILVQDFARFDLTSGLGINESLVMDLQMRAPKTPGTFIVRLDLLQEEVCWFSQRGSQPLDLTLIVSNEITDSTCPGVLLHQLELLEPKIPVSLPVGELLSLRVRVKNQGNTRWLKGLPGAIGYVALGGHLKKIGGERLADFFRVVLPCDAAPGETVEFVSQLALPAVPGKYQLEIDLVDEGIAWFSRDGSVVTVLDIDISTRDDD